MSNYKRTRGLISLPGMLNEAECEAVDFLREYEPPEGYQLSFSGGKDSIVMRHLADLAGVKYKALFNCTTIDPPQIYSFIRKHYPDTTWHYPKENFFKLVEKNGPAWRKVRWCCRLLKESGDIPGFMHILIGIRSEESAARAKRKRIQPDIKGTGKTYYAPIHKWKEWQIWEHIERYSLPYPSLYDNGFNRVGCKICPLTFGISRPAMSRLQKAKSLYPHFIAHFEASLKRWFLNVGVKNEKNKGISFERWLDYYYRGFQGER